MNDPYLVMRICDDELTGKCADALVFCFDLVATGDISATPAVMPRRSHLSEWCVQIGENAPEIVASRVPFDQQSRVSRDRCELCVELLKPHITYCTLQHFTRKCLRTIYAKL
jgi:hypothetical protein